MSICLSGIADEAAKASADQIKVHSELNWREIELRSFNKTSLADLDPKEFSKLKNGLQDFEIKASVVCSNIGNWGSSIAFPFESDLAEFNSIVEKMHELNSKFLRIMSYPNSSFSDGNWKKEVFRRLKHLTRLAETEGIVLLHENCAGYGGQSAEHTLELVEEIDSPAFRLLFDIGNGLEYGYNSYDFLKIILPWVSHVHIKDGTKHNGVVEYSYPGEGSANVEKCIKALIKNGYKGIFSIEPHLNLIPHKKESISKCHSGKNELIEDYINYGKSFETILKNFIDIQYNPSDCHNKY